MAQKVGQAWQLGNTGQREQEGGYSKAYAGQDTEAGEERRKGRGGTSGINGSGTQRGKVLAGVGAIWGQESQNLRSESSGKTPLAAWLSSRLAWSMGPLNCWLSHSLLGEQPEADGRHKDGQHSANGQLRAALLLVRRCCALGLGGRRCVLRAQLLL